MRIPNSPRTFLRSALAAGLLGVALAATLTGATSPALAQDSQIKGLLDRMDRLQRELVTLQRQVYRGEPPQAPTATGPAAARPAVADSVGMSTTAAARIEWRLSQFEAQLREITGQVEEVTHWQNQLRDQIDRAAADIDSRLIRLERQTQVAARTMGSPNQNRAALGSAGQPKGDGGPQIIGTIRAEDLQALRSEKVESAAQPGRRAASSSYTLPGKTPEEQYGHAFGLLSQANYGEAERALRAFVDQNPNDPLAGNAKYWLGETYYVRQDYQQAAVTFAEAFQQYPENAKAPDNLLKLGMSLAVLGSKSDACGTFAELLKRFPKSAVMVRQRANRERQRLACP